MATRSVSAFDVTGWDQTRYEEEAAGPVLSRVTIRKSYHGDLAGESTAELLMCQADPSDLSSGAGYVASERVVGHLGGREGTFVMQHWGISGSGVQRTSGHVIPGSGTGELAGLSGDVEIAVDANGGHKVTLTYDLE